jgi:hypothetical protein
MLNYLKLPTVCKSPHCQSLVTDRLISHITEYYNSGAGDMITYVSTAVNKNIDVD